LRTRSLPSNSTKRTQMKRWKAQVAQVVELQVGLGARPKIQRHGGRGAECQFWTYAVLKIPDKMGLR
jgi:hypothetical protein